MASRVLMLLRRGFALLIDLYVFVYLILQTGKYWLPLFALGEGESQGFLMMLPITVIVVCRDVFGRSFGKWVMRLTIVQTNAFEKPPVKKLLLRGIFVPVAPFDAIVVLLTGNPRPIDRYLGLDVVSTIQKKK